MAISKCDQFDFLIDIVPRHEVKPQPVNKPRYEAPRSSPPAEQVSYIWKKIRSTIFIFNITHGFVIYSLVSRDFTNITETDTKTTYTQKFLLCITMIVKFFRREVSKCFFF